MLSKSNRENVVVEEKDPRTGITINRYSKGNMLGKGGFAKCYQFTDLNALTKHAAKIVEKATLMRSKAKQKLASQIKIHKSIKSSHVVKYEKFFEDENNVYIILELCTNQTMNQLIKRRKKITEVQAKYYLHQLALALKDLHAQGVIHRDLKLGNLLLTEKLELKLGDFGLAAKLNSPSQRRKTMCGTPNYIAPQILENLQGHSFEVDIWSFGVIAYACLFGKPPFQTNDIKATYSKIKACNYNFPEMGSVSKTAKSFISKMLQREPRKRATMDQILSDQFFTLCAFPAALPISTLACAPNNKFLRNYQPESSLDRPESSQPISIQRNASQSQLTKEGIKTDRFAKENSLPKGAAHTNSIENVGKVSVQRAASTAGLIRKSVHHGEGGKVVPNRKSAQVWVMYFEQNKKFGISYMLNSKATGMRFNDSTFMIANVGFTRVRYVSSLQRQNQNQVYEVKSIPEELRKKEKIISYYHKELRTVREEHEAKMTNQQLIQRQSYRFREEENSAMAVFVTRHFKNSKVDIFWLNNKDVQVIFKDSTQLLLSKDTITYVNKLAQRRYFERPTLHIQPDQVVKRMDYAAKLIQNIQEERQSRRWVNKENQPEQLLSRSSSTYRLQKLKTTKLMKVCSSMSRIPSSKQPLK